MRLKMDRLISSGDERVKKSVYFRGCPSEGGEYKTSVKIHICELSSCANLKNN